MRAVKPEATAAATSTKPQCESTFIAAAAASTAVTTNPRVVGGTFLDVTRMYLDFFELHGEPETDFRGDNLFALVSTLHRLTAGFSYPSAEADAGENDGGDGSGGDDSDSEDS
tara:strand:- start:317 stop:655 length:339 start_codon:yes stop_codon:yes gene_type:complete